MGKCLNYARKEVHREMGLETRVVRRERGVILYVGMARRFVTLIMSPILNSLISIQCDTTQNLSHRTLNSESRTHHVIVRGGGLSLTSSIRRLTFDPLYFILYQRPTTTYLVIGLIAGRMCEPIYKEEIKYPSECRRIHKRFHRSHTAIHRV